MKSWVGKAMNFQIKKLRRARDPLLPRLLFGGIHMSAQSITLPEEANA